MLHILASLQKAALSARARTGDRGISTRVNGGKFQVVRVTYDARGKSTVTPCSGWLSASEAVAFLKTYSSK